MGSLEWLNLLGELTSRVIVLQQIYVQTRGCASEIKSLQRNQKIVFWNGRRKLHQFNNLGKARKGAKDTFNLMHPVPSRFKLGFRE